MNTNPNIRIPQTPTSVKQVAIYCRVSTDDQEREGTSLQTQRQACLDYCQSHHYQATHQFIETASGLTLDRPQLVQLRSLVRAGEIKGIVIYCLDRISRDPTHGVILTQELERHHVSLEAVTEDIDNTELGRLISYIRGYAAKLEAEKIKERTTRGIRSRVMDKRLPVTYRQPFGYSWDRENKKLVPNSDHETVRLIIDWAIAGKSYDFIIAELKRRAIPSPTGLADWNKHTLSAICHNPVYAGQFYAFKSKAKEPVKRNGTRYGKTSVERLPQDSWQYLPEIEIVEPILTPEKQAILLEQLKKRQNLSSRHAKRDYLLRGFVRCMTHTGKGGQPRIYHGQPHRKIWRYVCPVGGCDTPYLDGPQTEELVKAWVTILFTKQPEDFYKKLAGGEGKKDMKEAIESELSQLEKEKGKVAEKMATLEDRFISGLVGTDERDILRARYQAQIDSNGDNQDKLLEQLAVMDREKEAVEAFIEMRDRFLARLRLSVGAVDWADLEKPLRERGASEAAIAELEEVYKSVQVYDSEVDPFSPAEWRDLLTWIGFNLDIHPTGTKGMGPAAIGIGGKEVWFKMVCYLPIVEHSPEAGFHNVAYYPINLNELVGVS